MFTVPALLIEVCKRAMTTTVAMTTTAETQKKAMPVVLFVLGGPGSGKGTQCANIVRVSLFFPILLG